jgi:hypothetical protein
MNQSLCESCNFKREVLSGRKSRFFLCRLSQSNPGFVKYPPQPVIQCGGYQASAKVTIAHEVREHDHG